MKNRYKLVTTDKAKSDIKGIINYIAKDNTKAALSVAELFKKTFDMLTEYPLTGKTKEGLKDKYILVYTVKRRYSIIYKIIDEKIVVFRVLTNYQNIFALL